MCLVLILPLKRQYHCDANQLCPPAFLQSHSHDTTGSSATGVSGLQGVWVTTLTKVIGAGVDDDGSADDRVSAEKRDVLVGDVDRGVSRAVSLDVSCRVSGVNARRGD